MRMWIRCRIFIEMGGDEATDVLPVCLFKSAHINETPTKMFWCLYRCMCVTVCVCVCVCVCISVCALWANFCPQNLRDIMFIILSALWKYLCLAPRIKSGRCSCYLMGSL